MLNEIIWNGRSSTEFGIRVERMPVLNRSARKYQTESVPGRNGNIYQFEEAWEEVVQPYEIFAGGQQKGDAVESFTAIMEWLHSADDYAILQDSYDPTHYRKAVFVDNADIESMWHTYGRATINFRCRPERYLANVGNVSISSYNWKDIINPTNHPSKPTIVLTGEGAGNKFDIDRTQSSTTTTAYVKKFFNSSDLEKYIVGVDVDSGMGGIDVLPTKVPTFSITPDSGSISVSANEHQYGLGFLVKVVAGTTYTLSWQYNNNYNQYISYWFLTNNAILNEPENINTHQFTPSTDDPEIKMFVPDDCQYVFIAIAGTHCDISNLMLAIGDEVQPFRKASAKTHTMFFRSEATKTESTVYIKTAFKKAIFNCETENVTIEGQNGNPYVSAVYKSTERNPAYLGIGELTVGKTTVAMQTNMSAVITPNYWEL